MAAWVRAVQAEYGHDTVAVYLGNSDVHSWGPIERFLRHAVTLGAHAVPELKESRYGVIIALLTLVGGDGHVSKSYKSNTGESDVSMD